MTTSYYNGISGMKSSQVGIDVLGDNIANVNTTGFKQQNVDFSSLFSNSLNTALSSPVTSDIGMSSTVASTTMDLSQGSIQKTDSVFDMAIEGQGWMKVKDGNDQSFYTRTGSFTRDADGTVVNPSGDKLQVANPNNLTFDGSEWKFDSTIPTDNLLTNGTNLSSIQLPESVVFPSQATQKVSISGNLANQNLALTPKVATNSSDFGVLYNANNENMNMQTGQDVAFGFGNNISYSEGLIRYDMCIDNDKIDGKDVNVNFDVNGENIKLTLPDGSSSKDIVDGIAKELDNKNILYSKTDNSLQIKDTKTLNIQSNGGDIVPENSSMSRLVYDKNDNTNENFTTVQDFEDKLQKMADFTYSGKATVSLDDKGKLFIKNNTDNMDITASSYSTDKSNDSFINNLGTLGNIVKPNTSSSSLSFNQNYQGFTGDIVDSNGNKNDLKFDFYKTKIDGDNTIWNLNISELDENGNVLSSQNQDLTFGSTGALLDPTSINFYNNGTSTNIDLGGGFTGITDIDKTNSGFGYSQDGYEKGSLLGYDIADNGDILASFSNSKTGVVGQIPIYHFQNEQGLDSIGGGMYSTTNNSGDALTYKNSNGGYLSGAKIENYALETSNVNMGQAMTQLIVIQKAFDANSKSITTSDQMIQKAIDMKR